MIETHPYTHSVLLLFSVYIIKTLCIRLVPHEPLQAFRFYCLQLAHKVNKPSNSPNQRTIAGLVAILITLPPLLIILWLFADFIVVGWMWEALLLYIALGSPAFFQASKNITRALQEENNPQAKLLLQPWVLREVTLLSSMGLTKSTIEMLLLRTSQGLIGVCFYFLIGGGLWALAYRLVLEMHYSWNIKQDNFKNFGQVSCKLSNALQWIPTRLFSLILIMSAAGRNSIQCIRVSYGSWFALNNNLLLSSLAAMLNIQLSGVAMYNKIKLRRTAFNNTGTQPQLEDLFNTIKTLQLCLVMFWFILLGTAMIPWLMSLG